MCVSVFHLSLFSSKPDNIDATLSVCLQLIHHHGTGDLLDAKHPGLLHLTTASNHLYSSWSWEAVYRPIVQTDQQNLFLSLGSSFGLAFYILPHIFLWHWKTWLTARVVFAVHDLKDEMAEWNIVDFNVPKVVPCALTTLSGLKISILCVLWNSEMDSPRLFHAFSRLSFTSSFPFSKSMMSAQDR